MNSISADKVEKVTRKVRVGASEEKIDTELEQEVTENTKKEEDVDMSDNEESKPKPRLRKKKEKKVIPVGRNGLKKRPVTKTRTIKKDDGWST
jgi:DNA polymerase delta subunit 3